MLRAGRMEEFVTEEEEPWYDQRNLEQGEPLYVFVAPHPQSRYPPDERLLKGGAVWEIESHFMTQSHFMQECAHS